MSAQRKTYNFIERTQKILEQYDSLGLPEKENYDVTLLLNACVGLLVIIKEKYNNMLPTNPIKGLDEIIQATTKCAYYDKANKILIDENTEISSICRHLRNSIAHTNFKLLSTNRKIDRIYFKDFADKSHQKSKMTFEAEIKVETFKKFLIALSESILKQTQRKKK